MRVDPTFAVPVIFGVGPTKEPLTTAAVAAEVLAILAKPAFDPVAITVSVFPTWALVGL